MQSIMTTRSCYIAYVIEDCQVERLSDRPTATGLAVVKLISPVPIACGYLLATILHLTIVAPEAVRENSFVCYTEVSCLLKTTALIETLAANFYDDDDDDICSFPLSGQDCEPRRSNYDRYLGEAIITPTAPSRLDVTIPRCCRK
jgi:hypothetical protein